MKPIDQDPAHAPKAAAEFVYHREDILQTYQRPYHSRSAADCLEDATKLWLAAVEVAAQIGLTSLIAYPGVASKVACNPAHTKGHGRVPSSSNSRSSSTDSEGCTSLMIHH